MLAGMKIVTSLHMVEAGEPYEEIRTWRERLFSTPWRPLQAMRTVVPVVPKREAIRLPDGALVMHPIILEELKRHIQRTEK